MNATDLVLASLTLGAPSTPFSEDLKNGQSMRFVPVQSKKRQLNLVIQGVVATARQEFKGDLSFFMEPAAGVLEKLIALENLLDVEGATVDGVDVADLDYAHRPTINQDNQMRIKLKTKGDAWKFSCSDASFGLDADLEVGTKIAVTVAPGFYFADQDQKYGLYYTLKDLTFEKAAKKVIKRK